MNVKVSYRKLGNTGLLVSPIALGTMQFGWSTDEAASHAILSSYVDSGGNLMGASALGLSEEEIGEISNVADWERSRTDREA